MNAQLLVHGIVQQTMVLVAQVATVGGVRAPLAQVANQVFLDLTNELSAQGLGKHVIADMFGMALRTYHRKARAVAESQTDRGRVREQRDEQGVRYVSERFDVPVGSEGGWEAAVLDHFQALVAAICVKLRAGTSRSQHSDATGGGTFTFGVWPGHPLEDDARSVLPRVRALVNELRERIDRHNASTVGPAVQTPVVFYMGQYVKTDDGIGGMP